MTTQTPFNLENYLTNAKQTKKLPRANHQFLQFAKAQPYE
jgi:hypothetical protein